jgi:zona occludens toxin
MIELITGLPGNAKTLHAIQVVKAKALAESRPVFYSGIKECIVPGWIELEDATKWPECPSNSIILIDESQKIFRSRSISSTPPLHVTALEEHRHAGIDMFLLTQHPALIDPAVRRLTQTHKHLIRIFGMEASTIHRWNGCKDTPEKDASRVDSEKTRWAFDKSLYGCYHSADQHTMKRHIPTRLKLLLALPLVLGVCVWFVYKTVAKRVEPVAVAGAESVSVGAPGLGRKGAAPRFDPIADARQFVQMQTPRVAGLPQTAPKYDELVKPTRVPVPAMCIQSKTLCRCFTQQGTAMDVEAGMCVSFARNGFFQEFDPDRDRKDTDRTNRSVKALETSPVGVNGPIDGRSTVVAFAPDSEPVSRLAGAPVKQ